MGIYNKLPVKRPNRNVFRLSHSKRCTQDIGQIIPSLVVEMVPGDTFFVSQDLVVEMSPLISDFKGSLYMDTYLMFISYNQLALDDEDKFSDILLSAQEPDNPIPIPKWNVKSSESVAGSLWDYFGFPLGAIISEANKNTDIAPIDYLRRAYNQTFNVWFRDENLEDEVDLQSAVIQNISYKKDRFTSAFISPQKGIAPTLKLSGNASVKWNAEDILDKVGGYLSNYAMDLAEYPNTSTTMSVPEGNFEYTLSKQAYIAGNRSFGSMKKVGDDISYVNDTSDPIPAVLFGVENTDTSTYSNGLTAQINSGTSRFGVKFNQRLIDLLEQNSIDLSEIITFNINDLRLLNKLQLWMEKNQLFGSRYKEYLLANYGTCPNDETLQEPAYIGGSHTPIIVSAVVQQSSTDSVSPQGNKAGIGATMNETYLGKYTAKEFGVLMAFSVLRPKASYSQGIDRQFIKNSVWDFFNPTFQGLGQQEIYNGELFVANGQIDSKLFGYTDRYNEMRSMNDIICGKLRSDLSHWAVQRTFSSTPVLSSEFLKVDKSDYDYLFAVPSEPQACVSYKNHIRAIRPLSKFAHPSIGV